MTKKERLEIYKEMYDYINYDIHSHGCYGVGFCYALRHGITRNDVEITDLPEIMAYKPKRIVNISEVYWFTTTLYGDKKRLRILKEIIDSMSKRKKK